MNKYFIALLMVLILPPAAPAQGAQKYTCPMHPHYIADAPGTCPICGMDLVPVESGKASPATGGQRDGRAAVSIAPEIIQSMGVRTAQVSEIVLGRSVRAFGAVAENTRLQTVVASRVAGWIEGLAVTAVGDGVKKGDLLFRLNSPDLIAAQQDYLSALRSGRADRAASAARRLESLGVQKQVIKDLRRTRSMLQRVPFRAEHDGIVSRLEIREGTYVKPGDTLAVIQDYSSVWVTAAVAEKDLAQITAGQTARLEFPALPEGGTAAKVDYVHPTVDPQSRTGRVRLVLGNPEGRLRPGAYADIVFQVEARKRLAAPSEAILRDFRGAYVIKALGGGRFRPQRIKAGIASAGYAEILSGLNRGDEIVVSGQFLIDSESTLRESFRKLESVETPLAFLDLTPTDLSRLNHLVDTALYLHEVLTEGRDFRPDYLDAALEAGEQLRSRFGQTALAPVLDKAALALGEAQEAASIDALRTPLSKLVTALEPWITKGRPEHYRRKGVRLAADHGTGRLWLQTGAKLLNPYGAGEAKEIPLPEKAPAADGAKETPSRTGAGHEHN